VKKAKKSPTTTKVPRRTIDQGTKAGAKKKRKRVAEDSDFVEEGTANTSASGKKKKKPETRKKVKTGNKADGKVKAE